MKTFKEFYQTVLKEYKAHSSVAPPVHLQGTGFAGTPPPVDEEDRTTALIPSQGTLEDFLRSLEGKTIKDAIRPFQDNRFFLSHKYDRTGVGGTPEADSADPEEQHDHNIYKFGEALSEFLHRAYVQRNTNREEDTDEFKKQHNFDEYQKVRRAHFDARTKMRHKMEDEKDIEKKRKMRQEYLKNLSFDDTSTEYGSAAKMVKDEREKEREKLDKAPMTADYLKDDGSEVYNELIATFAKLGGESEAVIDV